MDTGQTIFTLLSGILNHFGITEQWANAATVNVMMLLALVKSKFTWIDTWGEESGAVAAIAAVLAGAQFFQTPWSIPVAVGLVWFSATFLPRGVGTVAAAAHAQVTKDKEP